MAYKKSFTSPQLQHEFPNAYHRLSINDSQAHYGVLRLEVQVFATPQAAAAPPTIAQIATDNDGNALLLPDRTDYIWEEVPAERKSVGDPIGYYFVELWNRKPQGRKRGDGGPQYLVDPTAFNALLNKAAPIPGGVDNKEKYNPKAQAYRLVRLLAEFSDATDDK